MTSESVIEALMNLHWQVHYDIDPVGQADDEWLCHECHAVAPCRTVRLLPTGIQKAAALHFRQEFVYHKWRRFRRERLTYIGCAEDRQGFPCRTMRIIEADG